MFCIVLRLNTLFASLFGLWCDVFPTPSFAGHRLSRQPHIRRVSERMPPSAGQPACSKTSHRTPASIAATPPALLLRPPHNNAESFAIKLHRKDCVQMWVVPIASWASDHVRVTFLTQLAHNFTVYPILS